MSVVHVILFKKFEKNDLPVNTDKKIMKITNERATIGLSYSREKKNVNYSNKERLSKLKQVCAIDRVRK